MNFVRSRLAVVGLLVAWPSAQLAGCAVKDREYGPASGAGGMGATGNGGKGGTSGKSSGGSSGLGASGGTDGLAGDNSGGAGETGAGGTGTGGTTGQGGTGGSSTGGTRSTGGSNATGGTGTAGEAGASGEAGLSGGGGSTGGTNASGGMSGSAGATGGLGGMGSCVPTGSEVCNDGVDNNCDGLTDCLTLTSAFPSVNGAASASDVAYTFAAHSSSATFQCRNTHGTTPSGNFGACGAVNTNTVSPFTATFAQTATNDGLWTTEVRLHFSNGSVSPAYSRTVYVHHTLYGVTRCPATTTDQAYVNFAKTYLEDAGAIDQTNVRSPFVQVKFTPPVDGRYYVSSTDGTMNVKSLRRNFGFSSDGHYLVMTRTYTAQNTAGMGCLAAVKRVHQKRGQWDSPSIVGADDYQKCTALVFNKKGAGYCLGYSGTAITSTEHVRGDYGAQIPTPPYSQRADNFAWRKLTASIAKTSFFNFSPKCDTVGCATGYTIYLPDKSFFPYFPN